MEFWYKQKSFVSMGRCATSKKISMKVIFLACGVVFSRKLTFCLSPHDFSKRLKIWNFGINKKVSSRWIDVQQQRKFRKKVIFSASDDFFLLTNNGPLSVKALLHRGLLLAQCYFFIMFVTWYFNPSKTTKLDLIAKKEQKERQDKKEQEKRVSGMVYPILIYPTLKFNLF